MLIIGCDYHRVRKQKTDRQDAQHMLKLLLKDDFPQLGLTLTAIVFAVAVNAATAALATHR